MLFDKAKGSTTYWPIWLGPVSGLVEEEIGSYDAVPPVVNGMGSRDDDVLDLLPTLEYLRRMKKYAAEIPSKDPTMKPPTPDPTATDGDSLFFDLEWL